MKIVSMRDPAEFRRRAFPLLLRDEARHNLMLGIAGILESHPDVYPEFRLWVVEDRGRVVGAASMTPPFNVLVSRPEADGALGELAGALRGEVGEVPGVTGAVPEIDEFVRAWTASTGATARRRMAQGIYRLERVIPVTGVRGAMRRAAPSDRDWLVAWVHDFSTEALDEAAAARSEAVVDRRLREEGGGFVVWEDGGPVSISGWGGETPRGVRIGPVYTPPRFRGRGYAGALVAGLSKRLLSGGRRFCFLYTDLSNPTSNRLYRRIGYEHVCDSMDYEFIRSEAAANTSL